MAAYQANYGFTEDGTPDASACIVDATKPAAPSTTDPGTQGATIPEPGQEDKSAKEAKQKGEKRKPEPGVVVKAFPPPMIKHCQARTGHREHREFSRWPGLLNGPEAADKTIELEADQASELEAGQASELEAGQ